MKKLQKTQKQGLLICLLILAALLIVAFAAPFVKNASFAVALIFGIVGVAVGAIGTMIAFQNGRSVKSKFYSFPVARIAVIYAIVQIIVSFVFMAIAVFVPMWIELIVSFILLIIAVIGLVAADLTRQTIEKIDVQQKADTDEMVALRSKANALIGLCSDEQMRKMIEKLAEDFRYSDPVSNEAVKPLEAELKVLLNDLQEAMVDGNAEATEKLCRKCQVQLVERNRICKLNK